MALQAAGCRVQQEIIQRLSSVPGIAARRQGRGWKMLQSRGLVPLSRLSSRSVTDLSGDKLLAYWQRLLTDGTSTSCSPAQGRMADRDEAASLDVHDLLQTALRVRQGKVPGMLPEQLAGMLISFYKHLNTADSRASFFRALTGELSTDSTFPPLRWSYIWPSVSSLVNFGRGRD